MWATPSVLFTMRSRFKVVRRPLAGRRGAAASARRRCSPAPRPDGHRRGRAAAGGRSARLLRKGDGQTGGGPGAPPPALPCCLLGFLEGDQEVFAPCRGG